VRGLIAVGIRRCAELAALGPTRLNRSVRYGAAILLIALATGVRLAIAPQEVGIPYVTYFPAATLAAVLGGLGTGLVATLLGVITASYLFIPPFGAAKFTTEALASALVFCVDEVIVCSAIEALRHYYRGYVATLSALKDAHAAEHAARLEAERANEAKSRFLAAASHDLRQPYQAMRLFLAALQIKTLTPDRRDEVLRNMDVAMAAGEELLRSLLDISTLDAGVVSPKVVEIRLADIDRTVARRHRPVAEAKGLTLRVRLCDGTAQADPVLLGRILDNLVTNAVRYTRSGGILVACRLRAGHPTFEVWDTGIGIAPHHLDNIFEEFFQVANPERDRGKGVGLGLAVVSKMAKLMGLSVTVASRAGRGTRFRVSLPGPIGREAGVEAVDAVR